MFTELHFHTKETSICGRVSARDSIPDFKNNGYDAVVVTDHFARNYFADYYSGKISWNQAMDVWLTGYRLAKEVGNECGLKVFLGCEISFDHFVNNDYLVYGITEELLYTNKELWTMTEKEFKTFADNNGLFFAQAHPFRDWCTVCPKEHLHGVEIFNAHPHHKSDNHKAVELWTESGLIPICGSDYHDPDAVSGGGVRFKRNANTIHDIVDMLFSKEYELIIPNNYSFSPRN